MHYLYYCNSAYQILTALNLHWHRKYASFENIENYDADMIILNSFNEAEGISQVIRNSSLFERVLLVDKSYNSGRFHALNTVIDFLRPDLYLKKHYGIDKKDVLNRYTCISVPKYSTITAAIWRLNRKAALHILEDGAGAYFGSIRLTPDSRLYKKFYRTFNSNKDFYDYQKLYLNNAELYTGKETDRIETIPKYNEEFLKEVRKMFADYMDIDDLKDRNIYYFAQFLNNKDINIFIDGLLEDMNRYQKQIVYIPHPRHKDDKIYPFAYANQKQIWELRQSNIDDLDRKLLISIHSTACFTPKILFDKEPYVLLFYDLCDDVVTTRNERFDKFVELFKKSYRDPDKIMIPSTVDEFKKCIDTYIKENGLKI